MILKKENSASMSKVKIIKYLNRKYGGSLLPFLYFLFSKIPSTLFLNGVEVFENKFSPLR